jgi:hypothetical protein
MSGSVNVVAVNGTPVRSKREIVSALEHSAPGRPVSFTCREMKAADLPREGDAGVHLDVDPACTPPKPSPPAAPTAARPSPGPAAESEALESTQPRVLEQPWRTTREDTRGHATAAREHTAVAHRSGLTVSPSLPTNGREAPPLGPLDPAGLRGVAYGVACVEWLAWSGLRGVAVMKTATDGFTPRPGLGDNRSARGGSNEVYERPRGEPPGVLTDI